jgi:hypothetical protein
MKQSEHILVSQRTLANYKINVVVVLQDEFYKNNNNL